MACDPTEDAHERKVERVRRALRAGLERDELELPPLPEVAQQVMVLAGDHSKGGTELTRLIHRDPALASQVLRSANSASSGAGVKIVSLQQAVARLGMQRIAEITIVACMRESVFAVPRYKTRLQALGAHAFASALYAKEVARTLRESVESAFLCGLLHEIGKPLVLRALASARSHLVKPLTEPDVDALLEEFKADYGSSVVECWELPAVVGEAIRHFGDAGEAAGAERGRSAVAITRLADRLASHALDPIVHDEEKLREEPVFEVLNLYPETVDELFARREAIREAVEGAHL